MTQTPSLARRTFEAIPPISRKVILEVIRVGPQWPTGAGGFFFFACLLLQDSAPELAAVL